MVFLEHAVDDAPSSRISRWWAAYGQGGSVSLPLVMVDSGYRWSNGPVSYASVYRAMVDAALTRPAEAALAVTRERRGSTLELEVRVTNLADVTLQPSNSATVHAIAYEETHVADTDRYVRATDSVAVGTLAPGESADYSLRLTLPADVAWDRVHSVVLVDYRPGGATGPYDMLAADRQE